MIRRLYDELDKGKELNDYVNKIFIYYISNTMVPTLLKLKEEVLIKEFMHQWKSFTILTHCICKIF